MKRIYYSYDTFREDLILLTQKIDFEFDAILAIARGGLTMAHLLGEHYDIREVYAVNTIGYDDTKKRDSIEVFNLPDLKGARSVLIVDDIVDSGDTMVALLEKLHTRYPDVTFKAASLFYKKSAKIMPDWSIKEANAWIDFFWTEDLR